MCLLGVALFSWGAVLAQAAAAPPQTPGLWASLITQAERLGLPTRFLHGINPDFVTVQFEDLRAFAAEYHPEAHRMVLNRSLSFNAAGATLRPLETLTHQELSTLYHELFHAYMDYLTADQRHAATDAKAQRLLALAREHQRCRYTHVLITPVLQRKAATEPRTLNDRESWEALNETWAVFVGWAVWTRLEVSGEPGADGGRRPRITEAWLARLKKADQEGILLGYYEPEDPGEQQMARKRYLAPSWRITPPEVALLLESLFETTPDEAKRAVGMMGKPAHPSAREGACQG
jgi:hypothetical protein